jgi:Family of unknown function (DUF5670)
MVVPGRVTGSTGWRAAAVNRYSPCGGAMAWMVFVTLLILWLLGFSFHVAGALIHILLVLAIVVFVIHVVNGHHKPV